MKKIAIIILVVVALLPIFPAQAVSYSPLAVRLSGRILLAVEGKGEAWYVNPKNYKRYYLSRPDDALSVMRQLGIGISNTDLQKIPESSSGATVNRANLKFISSVKGKIFLAVQNHGEAWYVNPVNNKRYYLGRPENALAVMRLLGLGISNANLAQISTAIISVPATSSSTTAAEISSSVAMAEKSSPYDLRLLEQKINILVNNQRKNNSLLPLKWNDAVAAVAREHSQSLVEENLALTGLNLPCDYYLIHHEGMKFGLYQDSRLKSRGVYYFSLSGENIAIGGAREIRYFVSSPNDQTVVDQCSSKVSAANNSMKLALGEDITPNEKINIIVAEIAKRKEIVAAEKPLNVSSVTYINIDLLASRIVTGWMNSPGHRANILHTGYEESGIGVSYIDGYFIATQNFINRVDCGYQDGPCCKSGGCYEPNLCRQNNLCQ